MSTNDNEIGIVISVQDLTADAINSAKKGMEGLGKATTEHGDKSSAAMVGMGFAAKTMAKELGVGGDEARQFSHMVRDMASQLSGSALAFGVAGAAAVVLYKFYGHLTEEHEKMLAATVRTGEAMASEVLGMTKNREETEALRKAKYGLYLEMDRIARSGLVAALRAQNEVIETQRTKVAALWQEYEKATSTQVSPLLMGAQPAILGGLSEKLDAAQRELDAALVKKGELDIQMLELGSGPQSSGQFSQGGGEQKKTEDLYGQLDAQVKAYEWYVNEKKQSDQELAASYQQQNRDQRGLFESFDKQRQEDLKREREYAALRINVAQGMAGTLAGTFETLYTMQGANARKFFEMYKTAAIAETIIATYKGAMAAYAEGAKISPYVGAAYAAIVVAAGAANVAKIRAQSFSGGGSAGSSSGGSSSSSSDGSYKYFNYEQSTYGSGWRPGSNASGVTINVQGNVYDANEFQKTVSKALVTSMRNNEYDVNKTVRRYATT